MADSEKGVLEFLERLRKERDELNILIAGIEKRIGISPQSSHTTSTEHPKDAASPTPTVKLTIGDIPLGFFHNLSQPAAAEKLLRLNPGQPLTSQEMLSAFRKSGLHLNPKNASTILYTALTRSPKFERVAGKAWGLAEWYSKKKPEVRRRGASVPAPEENDSASSQDDEEELTISVTSEPSKPETKGENW